MIIDLPLENWTDIFGFVPLAQLAQLVSPRISDRQFFSSLLYFLNKFGAITLGKLAIKSTKNGDGSIIIKDGREYPLADVPLPMPKSVKDFTQINLSCFDNSIIGFLQEFRRKSLLSNVNLAFPYPTQNYAPGALSAIMTNIMPLLATTSINSIFMDGIDLMDLFLNEYSQVAMPIFASARSLHFKEIQIYDPKFNDLLTRWLCMPRADGKARVLTLHIQQGSSVSSFVQHIKKEFLKANRAVSFFIEIYCLWLMNASDITANYQTNEQLRIKRRDECRLRISRFSRNADKYYWYHWVDEAENHSRYAIHSRQIIFEI